MHIQICKFFQQLYSTYQTYQTLSPAPSPTKSGCPTICFFPFLVHSDLCWLDASKTNLFSLRLCQTTFIQTTNLGGVGPTYVPFRCTGHVVTHPPPANIYLQGVLHQQILWNNFTKWLSQIFEVVLGFISQTQKPNILLDGPVDSE